MKNIKLGIIGLSEGNGHPYSWSAIFNGYDPMIMAKCPFPVIPAYLSMQSFPEAAISDAEVTHIWTQDLDISHHVAQAAYIPHVVGQMEEMIPHIDAVLLARDDAHHHVVMARPFLEAGLPIYIDKPLALTCEEVELLFSLQQYPGQLFTCSAFQYARELAVVAQKIDNKKIAHIEAFIKNDWNKYAIHLIEPIIKTIGYDHNIEHMNVMSNSSRILANYLLTNELSIQIKTFKTLNVKPTIRFFHDDIITTVIFEDTFFAFKAALEIFVNGVRHRQEIINKSFVLRCVEMLERVNIVSRNVLCVESGIKSEGCRVK